MVALAKIMYIEKPCSMMASSSDFESRLFSLRFPNPEAAY